MYCSKQAELYGKAMWTVTRLTGVIQRQIEAVRDADDRLIKSLDEDLELLFGEQEHAFNALRQHRQEHGC